jgi:hypothetical protein
MGFSSTTGTNPLLQGVKGRVRPSPNRLDADVMARPCGVSVADDD